MDIGLYTVGPLRIDVVRCQATVDGRRVYFTMAQWAILVSLVVGAGNVVAHDQLVEAGDLRSGDDRVSLRGIILDLRSRLGDAGWLIESVRGRGYRVASPQCGAELATG